MKIRNYKFNGAFALLSLLCLPMAFNSFYYGWMFLLLSVVFMSIQVALILNQHKKMNSPED